MPIRDQVARLFAKPKQPPKEALKDAARTPDQKAAEVERATQHRELKQDQAGRIAEDRKTELAKAALQHQQPHYLPAGASRLRSRQQIEARAEKALAAKHQQERTALDRKPVKKLLADAAGREQRQASPSGKAQQSADHGAAEEVTADMLPTTEQDRDMTPATGWTSAEERDSAIAAEREAREERDAGHDLDPGREMDP
jgi:hypothetical protein